MGKVSGNRERDRQKITGREGSVNTKSYWKGKGVRDVSWHIQGPQFIRQQPYVTFHHYCTVHVESRLQGD